MPFLIVDNPFVVELRCPKSQLVVGIRGGHDKTVRLQERFHQLVLVRGSLSKFKFARAVVQAVTELLEGPVTGKFFEVSIDTMGPRQKILSAVDTSRAKASLQMFKCARPHLPDSPCLCYCLGAKMSIILIIFHALYTINYSFINSLHYIYVHTDIDLEARSTKWAIFASPDGQARS